MSFTSLYLLASKYHNFYPKRNTARSLYVVILCFDYVMDHTEIDSRFQIPTPKPLSQKGTWMTQSLKLGWFVKVVLISEFSYHKQLHFWEQIIDATGIQVVNGFEHLFYQ